MHSSFTFLSISAQTIIKYQIKKMDYHLQEPYKAQHKETDLRISLAWKYWRNENAIRDLN